MASRLTSHTPPFQTSISQLGNSLTAASLNRRNFMLALAAGAANLAFLPISGKLPAKLSSNLLADLPLAIFRTLKGEEFAIEDGQGGSSRVRLREISERSTNWVQTASGRMQHESFTLTFEETQSTALAEGIHRFSHARYGQFELFVVPAWGKQAGYVASVSKLHG